MSYSRALVAAKRDAKWKMRALGHEPERFEIVAARLRGAECATDGCDAVAWLTFDFRGELEVSGAGVRERCPYHGPPRRRLRGD